MAGNNSRQARIAALLIQQVRQFVLLRDEDRGRGDLGAERSLIQPDRAGRRALREVAAVQIGAVGNDL